MDPHEALARAEQDRLATYLPSADTRPWYGVVFGILAGSAIAAQVIQPRWLSIAAILAVAVSTGALAGYALRKAGARPSLTRMPRPLRNVYLGYYTVTGVALVALVGWAWAQGEFVRAGAALAAVVSAAALVTDVVYRRRARDLVADA
ncbi:MAG: hypothetical protein DIU67_002850 [Actinomycetes bacterium]|jgi:hypothetical protein|nr:MAG: hypothetical protein DIU67_09915 [Actinomycetota bacterium]